MTALKVHVLLGLFCLLPQWINCQEHSEMITDSADMVTFRCTQSPGDWRLHPGHLTRAFVEDFAGMREIYSNCIGSTSCRVKWALVSHLDNLPFRPTSAINVTFYNDRVFMCNTVEYFHSIDGIDRTPLTISNQYWQPGYIYTTGTQPIELSPNITISNPNGLDVEIRPYYLYDSADPYLHDRMAMHIEGPGVGCVVIDHSEPTKWITTNIETIRIFFSSCSKSGRFGIGYLYHHAPGPIVQNRLVVMDRDRPLTGQHTCGQRHNRCPQPSPTPTPTSTPFPQHSTTTSAKDVTVQSTIPYAADATVSTSGYSASSSTAGSSVSSEVKVDVPTVTTRTVSPVSTALPDVTGQPVPPVTNSLPDVTGQPVPPVTNSLPDVTGQPVSPVTNSLPDVTGQPASPVTNGLPDATMQALIPSVNTSGTGPQHSEQPGVGVVVGGSIAGAVLLAVLLLLILVLFLRKRKCFPSRKQTDLPQTIEPVAPTAPGMETLLRELRGSIASPTPPQPRNTPDVVPGRSIRVNPQNLYAVVNKERRQPPPRPPRPDRDNGLTIVENDLYSF